MQPNLHALQPNLSQPVRIVVQSSELVSLSSWISISGTVDTRSPWVTLTRTGCVPGDGSGRLCQTAWGATPAAVLNHQWEADGDTTLRIDVRDTNGRTATKTVAVTVEGDPVPEILVDGPDEVAIEAGATHSLSEWLTLATKM